MSSSRPLQQRDGLRVLIVGAGIAGLTLAALLARQGKTPVVVDRRIDGADLGYGISLWPHGSRVLHALGVHDAFAAQSEPMLRYTARDGRGRVISTSAMPQSISRFGHLGIIARAELIALLEQTLGGVDQRRGVGIDSLTQAQDHVDVRLGDGAEASFDLVVGADGIHSRVRELLFGRIREFDTGWGCFVWWGKPGLAANGETTERWGAASFLGTYPCRERVCIILAAPVASLRPDDHEGRTARLAALLAPYGVAVADYLADLPAAGEPLFLWRMSDVRAPAWTKGRVALVGDAAAAFLPAAGIGASMALESAAVLADELSRTNRVYLPNALELYVKRRRKRVEAAQSQSRRLARMAFIESPSLAWLRNRLLRFVSMEQMVGPLIKSLHRPI